MKYKKKLVGEFSNVFEEFVLWAESQTNKIFATIFFHNNKLEFNLK